MDNSVSGLLISNSIPKLKISSSGPVELAEGQLIQATVRRVVDSMAWLEVGGKALLARTEIPLQARQQVLLEVTEANPTKFVLRVLNQADAANIEGPSNQITLPRNLESLLANWGIEADEVNLTIAETLLQQGFPVQPEEIQTIRSLWHRTSPQQPNVAGLKSEVETLVYLHTNELPVTKETLTLARQWLDGVLPIAQRLSDLQQAMRDAQAHLQSTTDENPMKGRLLNLVESGLSQTANLLILNDEMSSDEIASHLHRLITNLNTPVEAELANQSELARRLAGNTRTSSKGNEGISPAITARDLNGLFTSLEDTMELEAFGTRMPKNETLSSTSNLLHRLASEVAKALSSTDLDKTVTETLRRLSDKIDLVTNDLAAVHLSNLGRSTNPAIEQSFLFPIPLVTPDEPQTAHLKIFRPPNQQQVDPDLVRLALLLDLPWLGEIAVDLTVHRKERYLGGQILSGRVETNDLVANELGELCDGLSALGYRVEALTCAILSSGADLGETGSASKDLGVSLLQVNIRV